MGAVDIPLHPGMIDSLLQPLTLFMNRVMNLPMLLATDSQKYFFSRPVCLPAFHTQRSGMKTGAENGW